MTELAQALPRTHGTRRVALAAVLAAALAVASTLAIVALTGGGHARPKAHVYSAPGHAFSMASPRGSRAQGSPYLILRSAARRARTVLRPASPPAGARLSKPAGGLTAE